MVISEEGKKHELCLTTATEGEKGDDFTVNEIHRLIHSRAIAHFNRYEGQERMVKVNSANSNEMKYRLHFRHNAVMSGCINHLQNRRLPSSCTAEAPHSYHFTRFSEILPEY